MKETFERKIRDEIIVWGMGDVTHTPKLGEISLKEENGWKIGQNVRVTIETVEE